MPNIDEQPLVSGLIIKEHLTAEEIMRALLSGEKIKNVNADSGCNYYLENGELKSEKITYLKGMPTSWFNPDIKYEIDEV